MPLVIDMFGLWYGLDAASEYVSGIFCADGPCERLSVPRQVCIVSSSVVFFLFLSPL